MPGTGDTGSLSTEDSGLNRAARRRAEREAAKAVQSFDGETSQFVKLQNPVSDSFAAFVVSNALTWEQMAHDELIRVAPDSAQALEPYYGLAALIASRFNDPESVAAWQRFRQVVDEHCGDAFMLKEGSAAGQHLVICGAGPSLVEHADEWCPQADQVWGCNSAVTWLHEHGHKVTHGFTVDQTPAMCVEWETVPDIEYILATTVHPHLVKQLRDAQRRITFFHNYVGIKGDDVTWPDADGSDRTMPYEDWLYALLYPFTIRAGSGLNAVTRAIDVGVFLGFEKITVLGADCALRTTSPVPAGVPFGSPEHMEWLRTDTVMHADGGHALASGASPTLFDGEIDGRTWVTKVDMMISAVWLVKMCRRLGGLVTLIGDTLPNALKDKDDAYLARLPTMIDSEGTPIMVP